MYSKDDRKELYEACLSHGVVHEFLDYEYRLVKAEKLLQHCLDGFSAFINGRKMARIERDRLRAEIKEFLDANK